MKKPTQPDPEKLEFQAALLESIGQMKRGEFAAVNTPGQIEQVVRWGSRLQESGPKGSKIADAQTTTTRHAGALNGPKLCTTPPG